jgi:hypothetical protein
MLFIHLQDDRVKGVPLLWFPRLRKASTEQLYDWQLIGNGIGIQGEALMKIYQYLFCSSC